LRVKDDDNVLTQRTEKKTDYATTIPNEITAGHLD